jgi:hypothetical protein
MSQLVYFLHWDNFRLGLLKVVPLSECQCYHQAQALFPLSLCTNLGTLKHLDVTTIIFFSHCSAFPSSTNELIQPTPVAQFPC